MEMLMRKYDDFRLFGFYKLTDEGIDSTYITFAPESLKGKTDKLNSFLNDPSIVSQIGFLEVDAKTVEELNVLMDKEEERLLNLYKKYKKGDVLNVN